MNILILIYSLDSGGAEKQSILDANSLNSNEYDVTVACHKEGELIKLIHPAIRTIRLPKNPVLASLFLLIRKHPGGYTVIHSHMFWGHKVAFFYSLVRAGRIIFNEHGLGLRRKWYHRTIFRWISGRASMVICSCEENLRLRLTREKLPYEKLQVVYNSVDNDAYRLQKKTQLYEKRFVIGFTGRFHEVKRVDSFVYLAEKLTPEYQDLLFLIVGDGPEKAGIEKITGQKNLGDYFKMPGFVKYPSDYYVLMDLFVLPSRTEGFSLSLLEAAFYGIPSIAFDVGGNYEIIKDHETGFLVKDYDLDSMVDRIKVFYHDSGLRKKMGQNARNFAEKRFTNQTRLKRLKDIYAEYK